MKFRIFDYNGDDVTENGEYYIGTDGTIYTLTNDIDSPLIELIGFKFKTETI